MKKIKKAKKRKPALAKASFSAPSGLRRTKTASKAKKITRKKNKKVPKIKKLKTKKAVKTKKAKKTIKKARASKRVVKKYKAKKRKFALAKAMADKQDNVHKSRIMVIGIGGGGCSIINEIAGKLKKVSFVAANTIYKRFKNQSEALSVFNLARI